MVSPDRVHVLHSAAHSGGPVVYWMQRDQRVNDNWALLYAAEKARELGVPLRVVFCLVPSFLGATLRHYAFMLKGLMEVANKLGTLYIPFDVVLGAPAAAIPEYVFTSGAGFLVTDFNPLRITMEWKEYVSREVTIPMHEVDAHNILPCRAISTKAEYAAFSVRKKVAAKLGTYLVDFPEITTYRMQEAEFGPIPSAVSDREGVGTFRILHPASDDDWDRLMPFLSLDRSVPEVTWATPGESAAHQALGDFIANRLQSYETDRNYPDMKGQSDLSPWLHFGQLSAQRVALEVQRSDASPGSKQAFLEELIVRRELADNFCLYNPGYDRVHGFQPWAQGTLFKHRDDPREYLYSPGQFEQALTHDPLWNAAQTEMVLTGKMHGFMRMYWAKKILEWTSSPDEAMAVAIYLNDRYSLDGRDPNGYAGIAWSIGGTHDRPWGERKVFGMVRYMNYQGCTRKFDVKGYIRKVTG